ncbi:MAG: alpha/beta hydrolase [Myxococcota bacterium]
MNFRHLWTLTLAALPALVLAACDSSMSDPSPQPDDESPMVDAGPIAELEAPEVRQDPTYSFTVSTRVYGQGLAHSEWGGGTTEPVDLLLDVYEPDGAPPGRPVIVMIHGGGFFGGSRTMEQMKTFAEYFAERGWVSLSIDYRLAHERGTVSADWMEYMRDNIPEEDWNQAYALYPAARDAKAAIRWLYANAEDLEVDTDYITAIGGSAGSYLAIMLGVTDAEDFRDEITLDEDETLASTFLDQPSQIHTIIDHWGGISHAEVLEANDGRSRFDPTDPPVSIVHGTADPTVPFSQAEALRDIYIENGVPFDFHPLEGAGHGPWGAIIDGMSLQELALAFIVEHQSLTVID